MGFSFAGKGECLGVDIGASHTKVVHLRGASDGPHVEAAFWFKTPSGSVADAVVRNVDELAEFLRDKLHEHQISCRNAVAAVSGAQVTVREGHLPKMAPKLLAKSVRYEAARYIPTPIEQTVVEYQVLGESDDGIDILLVAAPAQLVDSRASVLERAGLYPLAIDVEAFGLYRALVETAPGSSDDTTTVVLLDLGARHTDLNIVRSGAFVLSRTLSISGESMNEVIAPIAGNDAEAADRLRCAVDLGLLQTPDASGTKEARAALALRPTLEEVAKELRRSVNYYKETAQHPDQVRVDKILIAGGCAAMRGLAQFFESSLDIACAVGDPFGRSGVAAHLGPGVGDFPPAAFATALGLAEKPLIQARRQLIKAA
jgi:type IV pilus assembly protein PilM